MKLDKKGRCCGRKPIVYKRPPHLFCYRCDRSYGLDGEQIANWAWNRYDDGEWVMTEVKKKAAEADIAARERGEG